MGAEPGASLLMLPGAGWGGTTLVTIGAASTPLLGDGIA